MALGLTNHILQWYPVYTNPRAEKKAYEALAKKGIITYLPLRKTLKQWSDRKKWVEEPFIKSYLFVQIKPGEQTEVLMTKGVSRFIYFSGKIATMPNRQMDNFKLVLASAEDIEITEEELQPGERVRIKAGPLKDLEGEVVAYRTKKQLALRFDSIGCAIIIHVNAALLQRV
jgi:transcriptional antiterminator RfaH